MSRYILLNSGPLGILAHPRLCEEIRDWVALHQTNGTKIAIPEIADYEVRRELLRADLLSSVRRLDSLKTRLVYIPLTTRGILNAAEYWSAARKAARPGASNDSLDGDVILAGQAWELSSEGHEVVVATENARHLEPFVAAQGWRDLSA
jgi:toxin FitB